MATLLYSDVDGDEDQLELGGEPVVIGRSEECTLRSNDLQVSRNHARVFLENGAYWIEDLGSANGVYVGAERVQRGPLEPGEIAVVGSMILQIAAPESNRTLVGSTRLKLAERLRAERLERSAIADERNALGARLGEMHNSLEQLRMEVGALRAAEEERGTPTEVMHAIDPIEAIDIGELELSLAKAERSNARLEARLAELDQQHTTAIAELSKVAEIEFERAALSAELEAARAELARGAASGSALAEVEAERDELAAAARLLSAAASDSDSLRDELEATRAELARLAGELAASDAAKRERDAIEASLESALAERDDLRSQLGALGAERDRLKLEHAEHKRALAGEGSDLAVQLSAERDNAERWRSELAAAADAAAAHSDLSDALRAELDAARAEAGDTSEVDELRREVERLGRELTAAEARAADTAERDSLTARLAAARDEGGARAAEASALREALAATMSDLEGSNAEREELMRRAAAASDVAAGATGEADARAEEIAALRHQLEKAAADDEARVAESAALRAQLELVTAEADSGREELDALRAELEAASASAGDAEASDAQLEAMTAELGAMTAELDAKTAELEAKTADLDAKTADLDAKTADLEAQAADLEASTTEAGELRAQLRASDGAEAEASTARAALERARAELEMASAELAAARESASEEAGRAETERLLRREADDKIAGLEQRLEELEAVAAATPAAPPPPPGGDPLEPARDPLMGLEGAITSLRASLRSASDEAAVIIGSAESIESINTALSQATEDLEVARDYLRKLTAVIDPV